LRGGGGLGKDIDPQMRKKKGKNELTQRDIVANMEHRQENGKTQATATL